MACSSAARTRPPSTTSRPATYTRSTSSSLALYTMFLMGSRKGVMRHEVAFHSTRSAWAPTAIRPRSSRPSACAPPSVAASNTWAAVVASVFRSTTFDATAAQRMASITLCGLVSVPSDMLTPAARYRANDSISTPRRANTHTAWATEHPESAMMRTSPAG